MVSILTRIFGLSHLETIEDAVQDTFVLAIRKWRTHIPDNPEAWLTQAAKHRAIDLLRKIKAENNRISKLANGPSVMTINDLFLDHEIEDSQLRMIFTACHPVLHVKDQIAFALKTIAGFSTKEIASALLLKEETIKKRLSRARRSIQKNQLSFDLPHKDRIPERLSRVLEVLYLIFNEGFHSNRKEMLIRKDLCGEAMRLCQMVLKKEAFRTGASYSLFGLMCFHSSRLESRISEANEIISIQHQDRSQWHQPLITLGNTVMTKAATYQDVSSYHFEAAIAVEHLKSPSFSQTNWTAILDLYKELYAYHPTPLTLMNMVVVLLQLGEYQRAYSLLKELSPSDFEQRAYLYFGTKADYYTKIGDINQALAFLDQAIDSVNNESEREYLIKKKQNLLL